MLDAEKLTIDTPEQVGLEFTLAGVGSRALAMIVDTLLQVLLLVAVLALAAGAFAVAGPVIRPVWVIAGLILIGYLVQTFYFAGFEIWWHGQTPGKRRLGLRVIKESGRGLSVYETLVRNLLRPIDAIPGPYGVGIISVLVTARAQRLGDLAAGALVVHERPLDRRDTGDVAPSRRTYHAERLSPADVHLLDTYLARRKELDFEVRLDMQARVAARIAAALGIDITQVTDDDAFLSAVADEYRSSAQAAR